MKLIRNWRKGTRLTFCIGISALCLYLALRGTDLAQVLQSLKQTHPTQAIVAVFFLFLSFWVRAWRWRYLLLPLRSIPVMPLFRSTMIGFMGNYLFPLRAGELIRAVSIGQTQKISKAGAVGSILLERLLDGITLSLTPLLLMAALDLPFWVMKINALVLGIYIAGLSFVAFRAVRGRTMAMMKPLMCLLPKSVAARLGTITERFFQGLRGLNQAGATLPVSFLSLLCWLFHGMYYFLLFGALDLNLSIWAALVLQAIIGLGVILPAGPGYIGNFEYFTVLGLSLFSIAKEEALAYSLLAHSLQFVPVVVIGLLFTLGIGFWSQSLKQSAVSDQRSKRLPSLATKGE